ncbi:formin-1-like [Zingiber officinale]|uniref:formin-1-like n=1 Tax=Zingiber officinale TaxID=94328 RepID=UPI001C4CCF78|nr:formin-1-like [Zingiber officinale]
MGLGGGTGSISFTSPAFREASQAARRARSTNDRMSQDAPSPSRRRARSPFDDSDSDDQPLAQRRRRQAPRPASDSGSSSIPSPPPTANASPSLPSVTPPPIPSHVNDIPAPSKIQVEPPLAQPSASQQPQGGEAGPSERPSVIPSAAPPQGPPSAASGSTAKPSAYPGSAAGPSEPPPLTHHNYYISYMSQACAESLVVNHSFYATHYQNKELRDHVVELELQLNDPTQASHALRTEIKDLTRKKNRLEVSLKQAKQELKDFQEKQSQVDIKHQQSIDQQALEHQRAMEQLTQKLRAAETLLQNQDQKLKSQEALLKSQETQLTSQATELATARNELARARATIEGVSTALAIYREGENDRCLQNRDLYLRSPKFCAQVGHRFSTSVIYGAGGALRQLYEQDYLKSLPPPEFLDHDRILKEIPDEIFAPFE